ncbi:hypothetical protein [Dickeya chrysanthemi]|uniref:hypothetical protein n=1 Tax=Dickeya chrysanthemi TaxID=556 RepID=UPI00301B1276
MDSIRRHVDYSSIHPYDDIDCLKIILGYVSRNAVRHYMSCEGSIEDMTKGLKEISELIGKGTINGRQKSKAHHEFEDQNIASFLRQVLSKIGSIIAVINHASRDGFVYLTKHDMKKVDNQKQEILIAAQHVAFNYGIDMQFGMHEID